ncbi:MAG: hypothetical protein ABT19_02940 [Rhodanobacter sp. SCN 68-63]|nr:MAG: hypothetical protein ABT19_02940 [Rhodanobacter sp. SCN 68-63]
MGVALSEAFELVRQGVAVDIKKVLDDIQNGDATQMHLGTVELPNGVVLRNVQVDTANDERQLQELMRFAAEHSARAVPAPPKPKVKPEERLSVLTETHLADLTRADRDAKTVLESRHTLNLFIGVVGDIAAHELYGSHCRAFFDAVKHWPRHASVRPEFSGLSVKQVLAKAKSLNEPALSQPTLNKHRQRLSVFLNWLLNNKHINSNPLAGVVSVKKRDAEEETGRPFTQAELDAIFEPNAFKAWAEKLPHRWWVPMLGLFSGARVNELSQLYLDDIETITDVPGFHINRRFEGQKIKNTASRRFVPLAQPLLDAGFLDYVAEVKKAGHQRLFPHLPNNDGNGFGKQMSKQFAAYIKKRGVTDDGMGMHAFRHTLATRLDRAGVSESSIARITGHTPSGGILPKFYIDPPTLAERVAVLAKFEPGVMLPVYAEGMFKAALAEAHELPAKWKAEKSWRERRAKKAPFEGR